MLAALEHHCETSPNRLNEPACRNKGCPDPARFKHLPEAALQRGREIYVFRDSRDVLVSRFHWAPRGHKKLAQFARDPIYGISRTIKEQNEFYEAWQGSHHKSTVVYYEDISSDPRSETTRLTRFLHMKLDLPQIELAVNSSSIESMRRKELAGRLHFKIHPKSKAKLSEASVKGLNTSNLFGVMTRKGVARGWVDELDDKTLDYVETQMRENLITALQQRFFKNNSKGQGR
mmetsp:Transcript_22035/g.49862  ORF Transcript_22035/g.49862 Transcript_22035/m.49862 type:complete len:232 (+) Transcript_22035:82-777(+)